ncbi:Zinc/iron permease [Chlamydoabsidia padenii]|nr:Zinc/iron permease [Chlamydoabsidia padenii]
MFTTTLSPLDPTSLEGWYLVMLSSTACIIGALVVFLDRLFSFPSSTRTPSNHEPINSNLLDKSIFLSASMSLGAGVLVFSSLTSMLPAAKLKLPDQPHLVYVYFLLGAFMTSLLTRMVHWCMPTAIHTCDVDDWDLDHEPTTTQHHDSIHHTSDVNFLSSANKQQVDELDNVVLPNCYYQRHQQSTEQQQQQQQHESGDTLVERLFLLPPPCPSTSGACYTHHTAIKIQPTYGTLSTEHKHLTSTSTSVSPSSNEKVSHDYLTMGIQTGVAICIHKFPEGLIMFISNRASTEVGISIAAAICIHNLIEGAMIAIPFYYATRSRFLSFLYAALLGGLSQPLGALVGLLLIGGNLDKDNQNHCIGIIFAIVSGMMLLIAIHSMLPQAIKADQRYVSIFFFIGIFIIGLASLLKSV